MKKNKAKKNNPKLSIEELCAGKPWAYIVEAMPKSVQRLTIAALEAYDKDNINRMEQAVTQIKEGDTRILKILLVALYETQNRPDKAIPVLKQLIDEEHVENSDELVEPITLISMKNILEIPASVRVECYVRLLTVAYFIQNTTDKIVEDVSKIMPLKRKNYETYASYLIALVQNKKFTEARDAARETISFLRDGELGKDYFWYDINLTFGDEEDRTDEYKELIKDKKHMLWAMHVLSGYDALLTANACLEDQKACEATIQEAVDFAKELDKEILYSDEMKHFICDIVIDVSTSALEDEKWVAPFRALLDMVSDTGYYDLKDTANERYHDLLPSGYRIVETYDFSDDPKVNDLIGEMLMDIVSMNHYDVVDEDVKKVNYRSWFEGEHALFNLAKFVSEDAGQKKLYRENCDHIAKDYPYIWAVAGSSFEDVYANPENYIDKICKDMVEEMKKNVRKNERAWDVATMMNALNDAYLKTKKDFLEK